MKHYTTEKKIILKQDILIGETTFLPDHLPPSLRQEKELGIVCSAEIATARIHFDEFVCHPRAVITPGGDYLLFHPAGPTHYGWDHLAERHGNVMYLRRSRDRGMTWSAPVAAWTPPYSQHAAVPFIPRGSKRIYVFGTEPDPSRGVDRENAPIAFRWSDDDGHTWSPPQFIVAENAPDYRGMSAMRMCETDDGTWLLGTHCCAVTNNDRYSGCRQSLLVSRNQGRSWRLEPDGGGWTIPGGRLHEGRPINLGNGEILMLIRSSEGHLWETRSLDHGTTWNQPRPTTLKHLEAPPMLFQLDTETLICFIHNRANCDNPAHQFSHEIRAELWFVTSTDRGHSWSEPRFVIAEAGIPPIHNGWQGVTPMVSYGDLLVDGNDLNLFIDHEMRQILQLRFKRNSLDRLPTAAQLSAAVPEPVTV